MVKKESITIIKHPNPIPIDEKGDILKPFDKDAPKTGGGWFSKPPENFLFSTPFIPLKDISQNSWAALEKLGINCYIFKNLVAYDCPYTGYKHFWFVPIFLFSQNINEWIAKIQSPFAAMYADKEWMKHSYPQDQEKGFVFTKVQRSLLGAGFTDRSVPNDGYGRLCDAITCLSNGDLLGGKIWIWVKK